MRQTPAGARCQLTVHVVRYNLSGRIVRLPDLWLDLSRLYYFDRVQ
jgi:hypothetical protein